MSQTLHLQNRQMPGSVSLTVSDLEAVAAISAGVVPGSGGGTAPSPATANGVPSRPAGGAGAAASAIRVSAGDSLTRACLAAFDVGTAETAETAGACRFPVCAEPTDRPSAGALHALYLSLFV